MWGLGIRHTRSKVFFALSDTKGSAMGGMESDAGMVVIASEVGYGQLLFSKRGTGSWERLEQVQEKRRLEARQASVWYEYFLNELHPQKHHPQDQWLW